MDERFRKIRKIKEVDYKLVRDITWLTIINYRLIRDIRRIVETNKWILIELIRPYAINKDLLKDTSSTFSIIERISRHQLEDNYIEFEDVRIIGKT
jgi:hypothetical protein